MIRLVRVTNPFLPAEGKVERELPHVPMQMLEGYLVDEQIEGCALSLNGRIWPRELWRNITPIDGDSIVISPILEGGGFFRTLASIAVIGASIAAYFFLGPLGPLANATAMMVAGAISAVGSTLVNVFMGPAPPSSKAETPSYAFSGPQTLAHAGAPIPRQYGRFLGGGCVIEQFTDIEGSNQYISALVCYGFGPAISLNALQLNGKDVSLYQNVDYYFRTGMNNQNPIPGFGRIVNGYAQDTKCLSGQPVVVPGTGTQTQAVQVDVQFPEGIFRTDSSGNIKSLWITYLVEYSVSGQNSWQPVLQPQNTHDLITYNSNGTLSYPYWSVVATDLPAGSGVVYSTDSDSGAHYVGELWNESQSVEVFQPNGSHSSYSRTFHGEWMKTDPTLNQVVVDTWTAGYVDYVDNRTSVLYNRTSIYGLAPNKYDVRITKYGSGPRSDTVVPGDNETPRVGEQIWVHNVNEITYRTLSYPNMVLVGVRALATNQLSGGDPQVLADISMGLSMPMPSELAIYPPDNPACVAVDMMTSPVYGGGANITLANIVPYIDQWVNWANLNETLVPDGSGNSIRLHPFNGIFDTDESLWAQLSKLGQMSRAAIVQIGVNYGVFVDQPEDPVQMFSMGNIIKDSFQESWLALDDRATQVDVEFADFTRSYRTDSPVTAIDPADIDNGIILKPTRIKLLGCTVPGQAWHNANFRLQSAKKTVLTGQFTTAMAGIACRPGNVVLLQHDVPSWGWGGRTLPGSTTTRLLIDRTDLAWGSGAYNMLVLQPSVERYSGTVSTTSTSSVTGAAVCTLTLSSFDNVHRVTRAIIGGKDMAITGTGAGIITVDGTLGVFGSPGTAYALYDTDVIDTQAVALVEGNVVTLATPLQADPGRFATYIYGPAGSEAQKVRVTSIRRTDETHAQIEWAQYDPSIYTLGMPVIGATLVASATLAQVTDLQLIESHVARNGSVAAFACLSWKNGRTTVGADIYGAIDGSAQRYLARVSGGATTWQMEVAAVDSWIFLVDGYDAYGDFAPMQSAPTVTIVAQGAPSVVSLTSIAISPANLYMPAGATQQLTVTGSYSDGSSSNLTASSSYSTSNQNVATVSSSGLVYIEEAGSATITATSGGISATGQVFAPITLTGISISPANPSVLTGNNQQLTATANYSDGSTSNVTGSASFTSPNTNIASVTSGGFVTGVGVGTVAISATYSGYSATDQVTVTSSSAGYTLTALSIVPKTPSVSAGTTLQLEVTAEYSDGSTENVTASSTYSSSNTGACTVSSGGLVTNVAAGSATITATNTGVSNTAAVSVMAASSGPATLTGLTMSPANPGVTVNGTQQLQITGTYSDGSTQDVTSSCGYISSNTNIFTVSSSGLIVGESAGSGTITVSNGSITINRWLPVAKPPKQPPGEPTA